MGLEVALRSVDRSEFLTLEGGESPERLTLNVYGLRKAPAEWTRLLTAPRRRARGLEEEDGMYEGERMTRC